MTNLKGTDLSWENMLAGILAQVTDIKEAPKRIFTRMLETIGNIPLPSKVYLVGCGDSWVSGLCTKFVFEAWAGIPVEVVGSFEFANYRCQWAPKGSMVAAVSISGRVSRTIEAVKIARSLGLVTVGGTANMDSVFSREVHFPVEFDYHERRFSPGTISYMYSLLFYYCLALFFALRNGRMSIQQVNNWLEKIAALSQGMRATIDHNLIKLENMGAATSLDDRTIFVGGGPNYGTAIYSMIKVIETTRTPSRSQELEEWAHQDYFLTNPNAITFFISPPTIGIERAHEQLWAANQLKSRTVAVCSVNDPITANLASLSLSVYGEVDDLLTPLIYCLPTQLFAYYYAVPKQLIMLGYDDVQIQNINKRQIYESKS